MTIDWDSLVKDAGETARAFEVIPEGDYDMEVIEAKSGMTKAQDKKKYTIRAKIIGGASNNRQIFDDIILSTDSPNALGFFFRKMAALGLTADYFKTQKPSDEQIVAALKGRRFRGQVGHRTWQGQKKHEIKNYLPASNTGPVPGGPPTAASPAPVAPAAPPAPAPAPAPAQNPWEAQGAPAAPAPGNPWESQAPAATPAPPAAPPQYQQPADGGQPPLPPAPPASPF